MCRGDRGCDIRFGHREALGARGEEVVKLTHKLDALNVENGSHVTHVTCELS